MCARVRARDVCVNARESVCVSVVWAMSVKWDEVREVEKGGGRRDWDCSVTRRCWMEAVITMFY